VIDPNRIVDQLMKGLGGAAGGSTPGSPGGGLVDSLMKSGVGGGLAGGLLSGAVAGALAGGKGGKLGKKALKVGGMALVAGIAWKAYQQYQQQKSGGTPQAAAPTAWPEVLPAPVQRAAADPGHGMAVLRGMIAAAKSDGAIDAAEQQRIFAQLGQLALSAEEKAFLLEELSRPLDLDAVVAAAREPAVAAEVYAASRLVIADASPAEKAYLSLLAARLGLEPALAAELDRTAAAAARD
jgi:uncharacterized membrane protein YebE (DUF533 family)